MASTFRFKEELGVLQKKLDLVLEKLTSQSIRIQNLEKVSAEDFEHLQVEASESHISLDMKNLLHQRDSKINSLQNDIMKLKSQLSESTSNKVTNSKFFQTFLEYSVNNSEFRLMVHTIFFEKKQAVLFRAHSTSADMLERMMTYSRQVRNRVDFWIQFNWHKGDEAKGYMFEYNVTLLFNNQIFYFEKKCAENGCRIFYYTEQCIQSMYPKLHFETEDLKVKLGDAPKGLHTEAINLWYLILQFNLYVGKTVKIVNLK